MSLALAMMLLGGVPTGEPDPFAAAQPVAVPSPIDMPVPALPPIGADTAVVLAESGQSSPPAPAQESEIVVTGRREAIGDPLAGINGPSFAVSQAIDDAVVAPIANLYVKALPGPVRSGIGNFLSNLREPVVFINYLLQAKPGKAAETLGRFAINTTIGAIGLFDVAKRRPFNLPFRPNGFANTFGYYGIKPGPFLFLPIVGATTARDFVGLFLDRLVLPLAVGSPFGKPVYAIPTGLLHTVGRRVDFEPELRRARASADPYVTRRDLYLRSRQAEIDRLHGKSSDAPPADGVR